jgi:hypothetical protein
MARRFLTLLLAFAGMVAGIEGIRRAVAWWNGVLSAPTFLDYFLIGSLPLLLWLWWRYLSPFGKCRGQCLAPTSRDDNRSG